MTRLNQLAPRSTKASRQNARRASHRPAREARIRRSFDGVVASYIRDLSAAGDTTRRVRAGRAAHPFERIDTHI
jgi:hypothetical protein